MSTEVAEPPAEKTAFEKAFDQASEAPEVQEHQKQEIEKAPEKKAPEKQERGIPDSLIKKPDRVEKQEKANESEIDKIPDPVFKNDGERSNVSNLRKKAKEFEAKASEYEKKALEYEAKIKEFDSKGKDTESLQQKLAELEKQNAEHLATIRKVNVELDPAWRAKHIDGRAKLVGKAKEIATESDIDAAAMESALTLKGKAGAEALRDITSGMDQIQASRLGRIIEDLRSLDESADATRTNPDTYLQERQKQEEERANKERAEFIKSTQLTYESVEKKLASDLEVLKPVDGLDWWNKKGEEIRSKARSTFETNTDPAVAAEVCIRAEAMEVYRDYYLKEREHSEGLEKTLAERDEELRKLYGKSPSLGGRGGGGEKGKKGFYETLDEVAGS